MRSTGRVLKRMKGCARGTGWEGSVKDQTGDGKQLWEAQVREGVRVTGVNTDMMGVGVRLSQ